ncbi:MAG: peptidoglycan DD-metalloendopeptidase family protein [Cellvibrionales bacterium]|nr:peptidoglycan DD-metalloendopeptidase family protein [Cellvibrionales bacterium]
MKSLRLPLQFFLLLLVGCSHTGKLDGDYSPEGSFFSKEHQVTYKVNTGDTLYSIARKYQMPVSQLAHSNGIKPPYTIKPGQSLQVSGDSSFLLAGDSDTQEAAFFALIKEKGVQVTEPTKPIENSYLSPKVIKPRVSRSEKGEQKKNSHIAEKKASNVRKNVVKQIPEVEQTVSYTNHQWMYPVKGKVIKSFSTKGKLSKGIDFAASAGTKVVSSRSGKVVYAGSRLKGYGNLIIIKHDNVYLTAYAHNRVVLVQEGDNVKQGQKIAEVGSSGTYEAKLHFEIRRYGKPIDPLTLLPK